MGERAFSCNDVLLYEIENKTKKKHKSFVNCYDIENIGFVSIFRSKGTV